jgi:alkylation response protein AidB-like acyl-CoA dehydrogenase
MAANIATAAYPMLTVANARLLATFGQPGQIETFARPLVEGRWFGTMCLSEPQAGSSLSDITTRAVSDGADATLGSRYRLFGNKMWISGGDHHMVENIVHLVLAKVPGGDGRIAAGMAGISLFVVPKWLPSANGGPGERNDITVMGLNHKMGIAARSIVCSPLAKARAIVRADKPALSAFASVKWGRASPLCFR